MKQKLWTRIICFIFLIANNSLNLGNECECCDCCKECFGGKNEKKLNENDVKSFVNGLWFEKSSDLVLEFFNRVGGENKYTNGLITIELQNENSKIKIEDAENKLKTNTKKWALFEIKYKKKDVENFNIVYLYCSNIESIYMPKDIDDQFGTVNLGMFESVFSNWQYGEFGNVIISVVACDTSGVISINHMFYNCSRLENLNLLRFNTQNVTNMNAMFSCCYSLKTLDISNFNTEKVTDMSYMFYNCSNLKKLDLSNFNTQNVTDMDFMFNCCSILEELVLSNFNTQNVTNMENMFYNCIKLRKVIVNKNEKDKILENLKVLDINWNSDSKNTNSLERPILEPTTSE